MADVRGVVVSAAEVLASADVVMSVTVAATAAATASTVRAIPIFAFLSWGKLIPVFVLVSKRYTAAAAPQRGCGSFHERNDIAMTPPRFTPSGLKGDAEAMTICGLNSPSVMSL